MKTTRDQTIQAARQRILTYLEEDCGILGVGAFYKYPNEEMYILEAFVPQKDEWSFLIRIDPLLNEIADSNDFTIGVLPLPPPVVATK
jgi:hypothetical protein